VINRSSGMLGALKSMREADARRTERVGRFRTEVEVLKHLSVIGVPKVMASGESASGFPYLISEWVDGKTLTHTVNGRGMPLQAAISLTRQLAALLVKIHANGVVHRDIKPDNLMIDRQQRLWLVDFGLSWFAAPEDEQLTAVAGSRIGNHFLVLPESIQPGAQRDPRSDVTLAVGVFFYVLTGWKPAQLRDALMRPPHKVPAAEEKLAAAASGPTLTAINSLFDVGFAPSLSHRLQSAQELVTRLAEVEQPSSLQAGAASDRIARSLQRYESTRRSIDAAIDGVEDRLVSSLRQIASAIKSVAVANGFDGPHENAVGVATPGKEVSVLWRMRKAGHHDPSIFYKVRACLSGAEAGTVELRLTAEHAPFSQLDRKYVEMPSADQTRLVTQGVALADAIFADAVEDLANLISRQKR
jgi:serine/threonine protein kinase